MEKPSIQYANANITIQVKKKVRRIITETVTAIISLAIYPIDFDHKNKYKTFKIIPRKTPTVRKDNIACCPSDYTDEYPGKPISSLFNNLK